MSNNKKPELLEKFEDQVSSDASSAFGFLGKALNAFLGEDEKVVVAKPAINTKQIPPKTLVACNVCQTTGKLGQTGFEIECPACLPNKCKTCLGTGKLGTEGYEIPCPLCQKE